MRYTQAFYPAWDVAFAEQLRQMFGLDAKAKVKTLSRGQRAQMGLLVALAHRPELLLLDEPSSGLDAVVRRDILSAIIRTVAEEGRTVLFSSHLLDEVERRRGPRGDDSRGQTCAVRHLGGDPGEPSPADAGLGPAVNLPAPTAGDARLAKAEGGSGRSLCNGGLPGLKAEAAALGAQVVNEASASLDEIFVARVRG